MAEKKDSKIKKTTATKKVVKKEPVKPKEQQFFAKDLAANMGIDSFDFLLIKREANIEDDTGITQSEMQKLYNKIIRR
jgi:hypothetical protein